MNHRRRFHQAFHQDRHNTRAVMVPPSGVRPEDGRGQKLSTSRAAFLHAFLRAKGVVTVRTERAAVAAAGGGGDRNDGPVRVGDGGGGRGHGEAKKRRLPARVEGSEAARCPIECRSHDRSLLYGIWILPTHAQLKPKHVQYYN